MKKEKKYYAFRANIAFENINLFNFKEEDNKVNRNLLFREFFKDLKEEKLKSIYVRREYILLYICEENDLVHCKLARKRNISINNIDGFELKERIEEDYPYVNVFIELKHQKILIENNTSVFDNVITAKKEIEKIMSSNFYLKNAIIKLNPIVKQNEFEDHIKKYDSIYSIKFKLSVPNWLDGESSAEDFLTDVRNVTFGDSVDLTIKNSTGNLALNNPSINSFVRYSSSGAGTWEMVCKNNNEKRTTIKSGDLNESVMIILDLDMEENKILVHQLESINCAFNKIEEIEKFKED